VGFALGLERLVALLEASRPEAAGGGVDAYLVLLGEAAQARGVVLAEDLRERMPRLRLLVHCGGGGLKAQLKKADRSGARFALILGEDELRRGVVAVKPLRGEGDQQEVALDGLHGYFPDAGAEMQAGSGERGRER
jgi:histidyl-tRNA synthetase